MNFGKLDIILNVKSIEASHEFYQKLGFEVVSWEVEERVSVLEHKLLRLVLMQGHVDGNMFNFRPQDISKLLPELEPPYHTLGYHSNQGGSYQERVHLQI